MDLIRGLHNIRPQQCGAAVTIGNFDGVHLGHQSLLVQLSELAAEQQLQTTVVTFEPQPQEFFSPQKVARLTRLREKALALKKYSVDQLLCLRFNANFAAMTADEFIQKILVDGLNTKAIIVGDDFRFGAKRQGDFEHLINAGKHHGFKVQQMKTVNYQQQRISSTNIRQHLELGELDDAAKMLGRHYSMCGRVAHGDKIGREWGIPTANIHLHRQLTPILGVFAVLVHGIEAEPLLGVASLGNRPMIDGERTLLEVHLLDFNRDIYGCHVQVEFLYKFRDQEVYPSLDLLKQQIFQDIEDTKHYFSELGMRA